MKFMSMNSYRNEVNGVLADLAAKERAGASSRDIGRELTYLSEDMGKFARRYSDEMSLGSRKRRAVMGVGGGAPPKWDSVMGKTRSSGM